MSDIKDAKTVRDAVRLWLDAVGADGLCCGNCCYCDKEDLFTCGGASGSCSPAYFVECADCPRRGADSCLGNEPDGCFFPMDVSER